MKRAGKKNLVALFFLVPGLLIFSTYNLYGIVRTFYYSMLDWNGLSAANSAFIGLNNYKRLFADMYFWNSVKHNIILVLASVCIQLPMALFLAVLLNSKIKGVRFFRTALFMPMLLSTAATGVLWVLFYDPIFGVVANFFRSIGLDQFVVGYLGERRTALPSVMFVICWQFIPFYMIILKAGLTNIPDDIYESAQIDGASSWQCFWKITLPLLMPTIRTTALLSIVGSLKYFDLFYVMTGGGPDGATELMATYMYKKGFVESGMGYASSIAGFMFLFCLGFACIYLHVTQGRKEVD